MRFILLLAILIIVSCKTTEDIQREKMVHELNSQMTDTQKLSADFASRLQALEERNNEMYGKLEENNYKKGSDKKQLTEDLRLLKETVNTLQLINEQNTTRIDELENRLTEQRKFLDQIIETLSGLSGKNISKPSSAKDSKHSAYDEAMQLYEKGKKKEARILLADLADNKKLKSAQKSKVLFRLGYLDFKARDYDSAMISFGKIYNDFPKAQELPSSLLFLGKCFLETKRPDDAKTALQELIQKHPESDQAKEAKEILQKIK